MTCGMRGGVPSGGTIRAECHAERERHPTAKKCAAGGVAGYSWCGESGRMAPYRGYLPGGA